MTTQPHPGILVVDDEPCICEVLSRWLKADGYHCIAVNDGTQALRLLETGEFALVLSDITMPGMSGIALLKKARDLWPDIAFVMITAVDKRETAIEALQLGAFGYVIKPFARTEVLIGVYNALERRRLMIESGKHQEYLEAEVRRRTEQVCNREEEIVTRLMSASEYRDDETGSHIRRIGLCAKSLAAAAGWSAEDLNAIGLAAPMHDIGKIGIPDNILRKPGKLTAEEFEVVKTHTRIGARILQDSAAPLLQLARDIALSHHEKWDGSGYPNGLRGGQIPEAARICAIVDVYDALVHRRVYRPALPEGEALEIMSAGKGKHFDPDLFECFLQVLPEIRHVGFMVKDVDAALSPPATIAATEPAAASFASFAPW